MSTPALPNVPASPEVIEIERALTRQVQQLQRSGYMDRIPDPDDRRAQRVKLTKAGQEAVDRVREAGARGMRLALDDWSPEELRRLASLFHRMVDDFLRHGEELTEREKAASANTA